MRIPESDESGSINPQCRSLVIADVSRARPRDDIRERIRISINAIPLIAVERTHRIYCDVRALCNVETVPGISAATERIENYAAGLYVNAFARGICDV